MKLTRLRKEIRKLSEMTHLHECFTLLRSCASACKVTHLMRTIPPEQLANFLDGFDSVLRGAMERILGHDLSEQQWLICQLPAKYGGFGLRSGKLIAGAQHLMSLRKCSADLEIHAPGWNLESCAIESSESWLRECIGPDFDIRAYLSEDAVSSATIEQTPKEKYTMSLAQKCEHAWYVRLLNSMGDKDRVRLLSNSGPTQTWVTALPLAYKNWNVSSREWLIEARRRLGLDVRTRRTRCSNCRFFEIGLKGDHALSCSGKMGSKMRHDAVRIVVARAFKQAGFEVRMEQGGGLLDGRRPGDVEVRDWVVVDNWRNNTSLSIDVAIIDATGDTHLDALVCRGVGAAATEYEKRKISNYKDIKGAFVPFVLEAQGGFGTAAKKLVRELEKRSKERECIPNTRCLDVLRPLGEISLVTAIGFEIVRRNARMILDRSPVEEPLIPAERTRIRLEMMAKKRKAKLIDKETVVDGCSRVLPPSALLSGEHTGKKWPAKSDTAGKYKGEKNLEGDLNKTADGLNDSSKEFGVVKIFSQRNEQKILIDPTSPNERIKLLRSDSRLGASTFSETRPQSAQCENEPNNIPIKESKEHRLTTESEVLQTAIVESSERKVEDAEITMNEGDATTNNIFQSAPQTSNLLPVSNCTENKSKQNDCRHLKLKISPASIERLYQCSAIPKL